MYCARYKTVLIATFLSYCFLIPHRMLADSVTLLPIADTTLDETNPNNNLGANINFIAGTTAGNLLQPFKNRALLKFDIAGQIPTGATITSASLTLSMIKAPIIPANSTFELRRLLVSWGEGDKSGNAGLQATTGEATWTSRFSLLPQWATPGGEAGTDFVTNASSTVFMAGLGDYTFASTSDLVADVQLWLDDTNANFGWMLLSQDEVTASTARRFASRESVTNAPALLVEYTVPQTPPPQITQPNLSGGNFTLNFTAEAGFSYAVEYATLLPTTNWLVLTNITAKTASFDASVSDPISTDSLRFYRLNRVPCNCR